MGAICHHSSNEQKNYITKSVKSDSMNQSQQIKITTKTINRTSQQCLLLFVDPHCNVQSNSYLLEVKYNLGTKVQDYLNVQLKGKSLNPGDCVIVQVALPDLKFKHIAFLCINVWQATNKQLQDPLQEDIQHVLDKIKQKNLNSVCLTGFNPQFGIPTHVANKHISRAITNKRKQFKSISVVCLKEQMQNSLIEVVQKCQSRDGGLEQSKSMMGSIKSEYY